VVDQLAAEYASRPVVFLEYYVFGDFPFREDRFWAAHGSGSASFPLVIVDSGNQVVDGPVDYHTVYSQMVDAAMARPAKATIQATQQRIGNRVQFTVQVQNQSGVILSSDSNSATVHAIVYEDAHVGVTNRYVRAAVASTITSPLASGATASFTLETADLTVIDWNKLHYIALADYRPAGLSGPYDMLQAAWALPLGSAGTEGRSAGED
jgi:hypothetical protein